VPNKVEMVRVGVFRPTVAYRDSVQVTVTVTTEHEQETECDQSNGVIFNDLE